MVQNVEYRHLSRDGIFKRYFDRIFRRYLDGVYKKRYFDRIFEKHLNGIFKRYIHLFMDWLYQFAVTLKAKGCNINKKSKTSISWQQLQIISEPCNVKMCIQRFSIRYDSNRSAHLQWLARVLKFQIQKLEPLYYIGSKQQRCWSDCVDAQADCTFVVRIWHKTNFRMTGPIW